MSGTQGTAAGDEREARTRQLFRRATAVSQEWADAREGGGPPDPAATERVLRKLADAERETEGAGRRALRMARGSLLAVRHLSGATHGGSADPAADRAEALLLLREAREQEPVTEREARSRTAVTKLLIRLLVPQLPDLAFQGRRDMIDVLTVGATFMAPDSSVLREDLAEVGVLLTELAETADPADQPDLERWTTLLRMMQTARDRDSLLELGNFATATGAMPPQLQMFMGAAMELLKGLPDATPVEMGGPQEEIREQVELAANDMLPLMELFAPGILRPEELESAVEGLPRASWQEQTTAGLARFGMAMRTGNPEDLVQAAEPLLRAGQDQDVPPGVAAILQAALLSGASLNGGNIEDAKAAQRLLTEDIDLAALADGMASGTVGREFMETGRALLEYQRVCDTPEDDLDTFDDIGERLLAMRQELSDDSGSASIVLFVLGFLQLRRTMAIGRAGGTVTPPLRRALMYLRESKEHPGMPLALRAIVAPVGAMCKALEQYIDPSAGSLLDDVEELRAALGGPRVAADQDIRSRPGGPDPDRDRGPGNDPAPEPATPYASDPDDDFEPETVPAPTPPAAHWEGLTETAAMARRPRLVLATLLVLVELPVYVTLFLAIHDGTPEGRLSAYLLSAAVGVVMTAGPFQAGRQWRRRGATASLWVVLPVAAALASVWAWAAWYLGDLRARIVFRETPDAGMEGLARQMGVELPPAPTVLEQLHLDQHTVGVTFISLLLLSGGIAFLLALSEEHPFVAAYRHHQRNVVKADAELVRAVAAAAGARRDQDTQESRARERGEALAAELAAVDAVFEAAAHAYLDGVQAASHDPAVTEGAMRLSARYPLLPEPVPTRARAAV
ncbi:hypothetical protein ABZ137_20190 [Streptomyces bobili]|uniref:hypothetical protein n=1 Tax=Streptomyces bobili TaxID=67280 RepID=UPI0033A6E7A7